MQVQSPKCCAVAHSSSRSVVLITSKGRLVTKGSWTKVLERLGADKSIKLKGTKVLLKKMCLHTENSILS